MAPNEWDDDPQAQILYRAESRFHADPPAAETRFVSADEAQQWLADLFASDDFAGVFPEAAERLAGHSPRVKINRNKTLVGIYDPNVNTLQMSSAYDGIGMILPCVLHEAAHVVDFKNLPYADSETTHDAEFAAVYLDMVALTLGSDQAERLRQDFDAAEVEHGERRVSQHTDGMLARGTLRQPSGIRNADTVAAARAQRLTREASKWWAKIEGYNRADPVVLVHYRRDWLDNLRAKGADLPAPVKTILRHGDDLHAARAELHFERSKHRNNSGRCGKWMPRACVPCGRRARHRGGCARQ